MKKVIRIHLRISFDNVIFKVFEWECVEKKLIFELTRNEDGEIIKKRIPKGDFGVPSSSDSFDGLYFSVWANPENLEVEKLVLLKMANTRIEYLESRANKLKTKFNEGCNALGYSLVS